MLLVAAEQDVRGGEAPTGARSALPLFEARRTADVKWSPVAVEHTLPMSVHDTQLIIGSRLPNAYSWVEPGRGAEVPAVALLCFACGHRRRSEDDQVLLDALTAGLSVETERLLQTTIAASVPDGGARTDEIAVAEAEHTAPARICTWCSRHARRRSSLRYEGVSGVLGRLRGLAPPSAWTTGSTVAHLPYMNAPGDRPGRGRRMMLNALLCRRNRTVNPPRVSKHPSTPRCPNSTPSNAGYTTAGQDAPTTSALMLLCSPRISTHTRCRFQTLSNDCYGTAARDDPASETDSQRCLLHHRRPR